MQQRLGLLVFGLLLVGVRPALADTHAPSAQTFDLVCAGQPMTFVSPNFHALAGQEINSTSVGFVVQIAFDDQIVFTLPAFDGIPEGRITTCTGGGFTFWFLLPPLHQ